MNKHQYSIRGMLLAILLVAILSAVVSHLAPQPEPGLKRLLDGSESIWITRIKASRPERILENEGQLRELSRAFRNAIWTTEGRIGMSHQLHIELSNGEILHLDSEVTEGTLCLAVPWWDEPPGESFELGWPSRRVPLSPELVDFLFPTVRVPLGPGFYQRKSTLPRSAVWD